MIAGRDAVRHGEAKNSWLTGTAAWNFVAVSQYLLGVKPEWDGLSVKPVIGKEITEFTVERRCRGATYRIRVKNAGRGGKVTLKVNGKPIAGTRRSLRPEGEHRRGRVRGLDALAKRAEARRMA